MSLPAPLFNLLPEPERIHSPSRRSVVLNATGWTDARCELRERFPDLAAQVFTEADEIAAGFALVVNDEVLRRGEAPPPLREGDEIAVIAAIAGG